MCVFLYVDSSEESDEFGVWESQQIRKGVNLAQLSSVCQENILMAIQQPEPTSSDEKAKPLTTADLLNEAYEGYKFSKPSHKSRRTENQSTKLVALKTPEEIIASMMKRYDEIKALHDKHKIELTQLDDNVELLEAQKESCEKKTKDLADRHEFYQQIRGYLADLADCFNEKLPLIKALEARTLSAYAKLAKFLIERRRQDIRDQAKEAAEINKPGSHRKLDAEEQNRTKRAAEREGRRTRRRRERERDGTHDTHMDGMSSDDEVSDLTLAQHQEVLNDLSQEAGTIFEDVNEYFCELRLILDQLEEWKRRYPDTYSDTFIQLCIPRICAPILKIQMIMWNPLIESCPDIEEMPWFGDCIMYAVNDDENEEMLKDDLDSRLIPTIVEKVILPKLNDLIQECWDPLSTTETLRLVKLIRKLGHDYPSIRPNSNTLRTLFSSINYKLKIAIESDVFIPLFPNQ